MSSLTHSLRDTNSRLRFWLARVVPGDRKAACITPETMAALLSELLRAGASLRTETRPAKGFDPELDAELAMYLSFVEQLHDLMPDMRCQLLAERAQLESQRTRVQFAAEWARASRQTL